MAIDYKNALAHVPSGSYTVNAEWVNMFEVPTGKVAIVQAMHQTNVTSSQVAVNIQISGSGGPYHLAKSAALPIQSAFQASDTSINLTAGQVLRAQTSITSGSDFIVSYMLVSASVS